MDYVALKAEIDNDPKEIGLSFDDKTDQENANLLNELGLSNETTIRESVNTSDIVVALYSDKDEFMTLTQTDLLRINLLSSIGNIDPADIQSVMLAIFTSVGFPNIRANLIALAIRDASRAEKLFGQNVSLLDVHKARRL